MTPEQIEQARRLVRRANAAYDAGDFRKALADYRRAYEIRPTPTTLFNMAQTHRQLKEHERALFLYESYLRKLPDAENRPLVERWIAELRRLVQKEREKQALLPSPASVAPPAAPVDPAAPVAPVVVRTDAPVSTPWYKRWYVWTAVGAVVAGGVAAGVILGTRGDGRLPPQPFHGARLP